MNLKISTSLILLLSIGSNIFAVGCLEEAFRKGEAIIGMQLSFYDEQEVRYYELKRSEGRAFLRKVVTPWNWREGGSVKVNIEDSAKEEIDIEKFNELLEMIVDQEFLGRVSNLVYANMSNVFGEVFVKKGGLYITIPATGWIYLQDSVEDNTTTSKDESLPPNPLEDPEPPLEEVIEKTELRINLIHRSILKIAGEYEDK